MKKFIRLLTAMILTAMMAMSAFGFAACGETKDSNKGSNKLYVGMECGYIPFNYTQLDDSNGAVKISNAPGYANGYDVMMAKKIAEHLGKELVIVKYEWDALIPAVKTGTLDFIIAGMSPTEERKKSIDFSDAYYYSQLVVVVKADGDYADATSLADLRGANIVAQRGTLHDKALERQAQEYGINRGTPMDTFPMMTMALSTGAIDGYIAEEPGAIADCAATEGLKYIPLINNQTGFTVSQEDTQIAVGLKKGDNEMRVAVNAALAKITAEEREQMMQLAKKLSSGENIE